jgi:acyl dehydratase
MMPAAAIGDALPTLHIAALSPEQVRAYAVASGDDNPIHLDTQVASAAGLAGCPVQGMLIAGLFETAVRRWRPEGRITGLTVRFVRPLIAGTPVDIGGRVATIAGEAIRIRMIATDAEARPVCVAAVTIVP